MKITVFVKKGTTKDGKKFYNYVSKLVKVNGDEVYVTVKFPEDDKPKADECPLNIEFDKSDANLSVTKDTAEDGTVYEHKTLWVKKYTRSKDKYVDKSLDEF